MVFEDVKIFDDFRDFYEKLTYMIQEYFTLSETDPALIELKKHANELRKHCKNVLGKHVHFIEEVIEKLEVK